MAGIGGKGVLMAGELLARAGLKKYQYISWFPTYYSSKRGGPVECTVILSDVEIASPLVPKVDVLVVMEQSQLEPLADRVKSGGTILIESADLKSQAPSDDVTLIEISATETAMKMGDIQVANMVLLGAYIQLTDVLSVDSVLQELEERLAGKEEVLNVNKDAIMAGADIIKTRGVSILKEVG
jgi:2-oxoglutarate ferredoxin oxidoreductase subunit gamma